MMRDAGQNERREERSQENQGLEVSLLLERAATGDELATDELLPLVYKQLRATAQHLSRLSFAARRPSGPSVP